MCRSHDWWSPPPNKMLYAPVPEARATAPHALLVGCNSPTAGKATNLGSMLCLGRHCASPVHCCVLLRMQLKQQAAPDIEPGVRATVSVPKSVTKSPMLCWVCLLTACLPQVSHTYFVQGSNCATCPPALL